MPRHINRVSGRRGSAASLAAAAAAVAAGTLAIAPAAHADYIIDLRAVEVDGQPIGGVNTPKNLLVAPGGVVKLQLFAQVSGANTLNDDQAGDNSGNIVSSTGGLQGNLTASPSPGEEIAPDVFVRNFAEIGSQNGKVQDLDGDGDLDVGTSMDDQIVTDFFNARSATAITPNIVLAPGKREVLVGHVTFTASAAALGETFLNYVTRVEENGSPSTEGAVWFEDGGTPFNPTVPGAVYAAGAPVRVAVPEPAAPSLCALAGVGLLARRERRRRVTRSSSSSS